MIFPFQNFFLYILETEKTTLRRNARLGAPFTAA